MARLIIMSLHQNEILTRLDTNLAFMFPFRSPKRDSCPFEYKSRFHVPLQITKTRFVPVWIQISLSCSPSDHQNEIRARLDTNLAFMFPFRSPKRDSCPFGYKSRFHVPLQITKTRFVPVWIQISLSCFPSDHQNEIRARLNTNLAFMFPFRSPKRDWCPFGYKSRFHVPLQITKTRFVPVWIQISLSCSPSDHQNEIRARLDTNLAFMFPFRSPKRDWCPFEYKSRFHVPLQITKTRLVSVWIQISLSCSPSDHQNEIRARLDTNLAFMFPFRSPKRDSCPFGYKSRFHVPL